MEWRSGKNTESQRTEEEDKDKDTETAKWMRKITLKPGGERDAQYRGGGQSSAAVLEQARVDVHQDYTE